jgi:hypothetical protein
VADGAARVARVDGEAALREVVDMEVDTQHLLVDTEVDTQLLLVGTEVDTQLLLVDTEVDPQRLLEDTEVVLRVVTVALALAITGVVRVVHGVVDSKEVAMGEHLRQAVKAAGVREAAGVDPKEGVRMEAAKVEATEVMTAETTAGKRLEVPPGSPGNPLAGALEVVMPPNGATTNQMGKDIKFFSPEHTPKQRDLVLK